MRNSAGLTGCSRARGPGTAGRSYCAGIRVSGKLRCLTTLPRAATMRILRATGIEAETELAFAGLYSLLHPLADELSALPETRAAALRSALGLESGGAAPEPFAVAAATHGLLTAAAESNALLLLLVDDLHWLDRESQDALMFALRRLGRDAIASVLTLRAGQPAPAGVRSCELTGLEPMPAGLLVEAVAGIRPAPAVAERLHAETGGNPLALTELAAALTEAELAGSQTPTEPLEPGAAIRMRFAARLDRLSDPARTVLLIAAAAGRCPADR
jgi:predicted ATPase